MFIFDFLSFAHYKEILKAYKAIEIVYTYFAHRERERKRVIFSY